MNLKVLCWLSYSVAFFGGGFWVFQQTSVLQFALVLLGYAGIAAGCLWWWTAHAYGDRLGTESGKARTVVNRTEAMVQRASSSTM